MKEYSVLHPLSLPAHEAMGKGTGACPGRVCWSYSPDSIPWDGNGFWWEREHFNEPVILRMVRSAVAALGGKPTAGEGWEALFAYTNSLRGKKDRQGYAQGEKIAIKANMNGAGGYDGDETGLTKLGFANPVLVRALLTSLICDAGARPEDITVYDGSRLFPEFMINMCSQGFLEGVHFRYRDQSGQNNAQPDDAAKLIWSKVFEGDVNFLPRCVSEASYVINLANLKGHPYGVTLCAKNHFGTLMNSNRYRPPEAANLHPFMQQSEMGKYTVLVDLMANAYLHKKTVLYLLDALICAYDVTNAITLENASWEQSPFCGSLTSSLFVSQDPVAIDSVGMDFLVNEPVINRYNKALYNNRGIENYLHEAALIGLPPSGTIYLNGIGERIFNIGVHEHWNNATDKQYGRNLGRSEGIELIKLDSRMKE